MPTKVKKIRLEGFRGATAVAEIPLDTSKPVILVFGENGTGKSTIADAFDFVCNAGFGSLEDRSTVGRKKDYVPSLGPDTPKPTVVLSTSEGEFEATLARTGPVVSPSTGCPGARVLRRSNILQLLNAQPKQRFEALKTFITVPRIEKSENALREAHRTLKGEVDEAVRSYTQAKAELEKYWEAEGRPGKDAIQWAQSEADKDIQELKSTIGSMETMVSLLSQADSSMRALDSAVEALLSAQKSQENAQVEQAKVEAAQPKVDASLLKLLQDAKSFINGKKPGACPVCEREIKPDKLTTRLDERLSEMHGLSSAVRIVTRAKQDVQGKEAVANQARELFLKKTSILARTLQKCKFNEIDLLNLQWSEFQDLLTPLDSLEYFEQTARYFLKMAAPCQEPLTEKKRSAQKSIDQRNAVKGHLETHSEKLQSAAELNNLLQKLAAALEIVTQKRKNYVKEVLSSISGEVERLYTTLHPGEGIGNIRFHLKEKSIGSLEFYAHFLDIPDVPPQAYYSESHLDTLGICVFLVLSKHFATEETIIVLDDVVTSVDSPHLERFMNLLHAEAANFNQVIVTTHYRPWRDRYRWARGPTANTQVIELGPWTLTSGLQVGPFITALDELKATLSQAEWDRQTVASKAGIVLESLLDFITLRFRCAVPRNARNEYTLGDLACGIDSKLSKVLCCRKPSESIEVKQEIALKTLIDAATGDHWIRNCVGCHLANLGSEIADSDVRTFAQHVIPLADALICENCGAMPTRRPSGSFWQCICGNLELHPLVRPGADPRTVADEC